MTTRTDRLRRTAVPLLALAAALLLAACGAREPKEPPDLTGEWKQTGDADYYHTATISGDTIEVFWYFGKDAEPELYWSGTFVAPGTGDEPYSWESVNDLKRAHTSRRASREEVKTFTYSKGQLSYNVAVGHMVMRATLEKVS